MCAVTPLSDTLHIAVCPSLPPFGSVPASCHGPLLSPIDVHVVPLWCHVGSIIVSMISISRSHWGRSWFPANSVFWQLIDSITIYLVGIMMTPFMWTIVVPARVVLRSSLIVEWVSKFVLTLEIHIMTSWNHALSLCCTQLSFCKCSYITPLSTTCLPDRPVYLRPSLPSLVRGDLLLSRRLIDRCPIVSLELHRELSSGLPISVTLYARVAVHFIAS